MTLILQFSQYGSSKLHVTTLSQSFFKGGKVIPIRNHNLITAFSIYIFIPRVLFSSPPLKEGRCRIMHALIKIRDVFAVAKIRIKRP